MAPKPVPGRRGAGRGGKRKHRRKDALVDYDAVVAELRLRADPKVVESMPRYGVRVENALGLRAPDLKAIARQVGRDHALALRLWSSGIHEGRLIATLIEDPKQLGEQQMEDWVSDLATWDVCDACCNYVFRKSPLAYEKVAAWSRREEEFVRRAGFALLACLAVHDKQADDERFTGFFPAIREAATDPRHYVKKAVNWALRQIGKRNPALHAMALEVARELRSHSSPAARWIGGDAVRELTSEKVLARVQRKQ